MDFLGSIVHTQMIKTLNRYHVIRAEMQHLLTVLQGYLSVEVLETEWEALMLDLQKAENLDEVIDAHERYLENLRRKALLQDKSQNVMAKLVAVLDVSSS